MSAAAPPPDARPAARRSPGLDVTVRGVRLVGEMDGGGLPVLLLHGFTGTARTWRHHLDGLAPRHLVVAPDLLGHGRSDAPVDPARHALGEQAADLAALLAAVGIERADVVGYSMGARLALRLAADHPGRVDRLVLESPSAGIAAPDERARRREADERLARRLETDGLAAFVDAWEAQPVFASHAELPAAERAEMRQARLSHDPRGLAASLRGAGQGTMEPLGERLPRLRHPTLVIAGERDDVGRRRAAAVASAIPGARSVSVRGAGHTPHLERPRAFARLLSTFLDVDCPLRSARLVDGHPAQPAMQRGPRR